MDSTPDPARGIARRPLLGVAAAVVGAATAPLAAGKAHAAEPKPTIVLVHGAFADASGWATVTRNLLDDGYPVYAPANPLRNLYSDADYIGAFLSTISGPVVLVGHSYGGAVITNAATGNPNIKALVYVAAFALDEGETLAAASALAGHSDLTDHIVVRPFPGAAPGDADGYIDPAFFRALFCADLPPARAAAMATAQRPAALSTLITPSRTPAWKTIPSWYVVARNDQTIPPEAERVMAARAGATTVELSSSHVAMISQPDAVTDVILKAARTV